MGSRYMFASFVLFIILLAAVTTTHAASIENTEEEPDAQPENRIAVMDTDYGVIEFELYEFFAPVTAQHFIELFVFDFIFQFASPRLLLFWQRPRVFVLYAVWIL